jgi:hypothetical protein
MLSVRRNHTTTGWTSFESSTIASPEERSRATYHFSDLGELLAKRAAQESPARSFFTTLFPRSGGLAKTRGRHSRKIRVIYASEAVRAAPPK